MRRKTQNTILDVLDTQVDTASEVESTAPDEEQEPVLAPDLTSDERVRMMADAADAVRADDILVLDLRGITIIADFFLIATGKSSVQIRAISDRIEEKMRDCGYRKLRVEGYQEATWILVDYGDVVVHIMAAEQRAFYNLEGFWSGAARLDLQLHPEGAPATDRLTAAETDTASNSGEE